MNNQTITKKVSFIVPCFNEYNYISNCVKSILKNNYPLNKIEILIVDGGSTDGSIKLIKNFSKNYKNIFYLYNKNKYLASAWNIGIKNSSGIYIFALNAHTTMPKNYIQKAVNSLLLNKADCVGPVINTIPQSKGLFANSIALLLSSPFGVGSSKFRTGTKKTTIVDTVHCGLYRCQILKKFKFNEKLIRSQDIEYNQRITKAGAKIVLDPSLSINYFTRTNMKSFIKYAFINGYWVSNTINFDIITGSLRHYVPMLFTISLSFAIIIKMYFGNSYPALIIITSYFFLGTINIFFLKKKLSIAALITPLIAFFFHILYGLGTLFGFLNSFFKLKFSNE